MYDKNQHDCINLDHSRLPKAKWFDKKKAAKCEKHFCPKLFGKIMTGASVDMGVTRTALNQVHLPNTDIVGRFKEMHLVLERMLSPNSGKFITVWGQHGIGKTAITHSVMHYISERKLIKGGFCYVNAKNQTSSEVFVRNFNFELVKNNPHVFGPSKDFFERQTKDCMGTFYLVLRQIQLLEQTVVFVIDGCESLIENDKQMFKSTIKLILAEI